MEEQSVRAREPEAATQSPDTGMEHLERLDAKAVISQSFVDVSRLLHDLMAKGNPVKRKDGAVVNPYPTQHVKRFGDYDVESLKP